MPSPVADRPGLLIRDPLRYSESVVVVPPSLLGCLSFFDGRHEALDLRAALVRASGDLRSGEVGEQLRSALSQSGFLEDDTYARLREGRQRAFAAAPVREPAHAGSAYPAEAGALRSALAGYLGPAEKAADGKPVLGIAAPHVSLEGGAEAYRAAYAALGPDLGERTFLVLGTSHHGPAERFGLTRKPYRTPLGETSVDLDLVDELVERGGPGVLAEDYCHAVEHSVEFQVLFLQHLHGPGVRVVPVLCGPFAGGGRERGLPEEAEEVGRFLEALAAAAGRRRPVWILAVDMAHVGRRYGDREPARTGTAAAREIEERDRARIEALLAGDAEGFWGLVGGRDDDLHWCGSAPLYAFLRAGRPRRGEILSYQQWNIDADSVVTFAGLAFRDGGPAAAAGPSNT